MDRLAAGAITDGNGNPLPGWFTFVRGTAGHGLMAVLQPPAGSAIDMDGIRIGNRKVTHGGQVAERLQMVLYGRTASLGSPTPALQPCIQHCCRPDNTVEVSKVNLRQQNRAQTCAKDAFPELTGNAVLPANIAGAPGIAAAETSGLILGRSRLANASSVE
jgi:hypothetical protein